MHPIISNFLDFIITPAFRWFVFILNVCLIMFAYNQDIVRYSILNGFTGLQFNWQMYIILTLGVFGSFLTFMGLWYTIPFTSNLPEFWFIPIFILLLAYYLQNTIDLKTVNNENDNFQPPPTHILPKKYRIVIVWLILLLDMIIFIQYYIYFGVFDYSKDTVLHRFLLERFGGWYDGNKLAFLTEILGIGYVISDCYNIYLQKTFEPCHYKLPSSWNF